MKWFDAFFAKHTFVKKVMLILSQYYDLKASHKLKMELGLLLHGNQKVFSI